jgi:Leucine-rich repeat (LRR) protein
LTSNSLREVKGISHLTKLKRLNLDGNRIGEIDIRGLNGLQFMSLRNNKINSLAPFSSLTHLVHLNVSGNPIQSGFDSLQYLTKLQLLYMKDCLIDMSGDEFSFVLLDTLASLKGLTHLAVTGNPAFDKNAKTLHPLFLQSLPGLLFFNEKETEVRFLSELLHLSPLTLHSSNGR